MERPGEVRLLVRGIAKGVAVTELAELFAPYGGDPERIAVPRDRRTRRRKGIAYVFVPSAQHAVDAIRALDNTTVGDKVITIETAAERPPKKRRFGGPPRPAGFSSPGAGTVPRPGGSWQSGPPRPGVAPRPGVSPRPGSWQGGGPRPDAPPGNPQRPAGSPPRADGPPRPGDPPADRPRY